MEDESFLWRQGPPWPLRGGAAGAASQPPPRRELGARDVNTVTDVLKASRSPATPTGSLTPEERRNPWGARRLRENPGGSDATRSRLCI